MKSVRPAADVKLGWKVVQGVGREDRGSILDSDTSGGRRGRRHEREGDLPGKSGGGPARSGTGEGAGSSSAGAAIDRDGDDCT